MISSILISLTILIIFFYRNPISNKYSLQIIDLFLIFFLMYGVVPVLFNTYVLLNDYEIVYHFSDYYLQKYVLWRLFLFCIFFVIFYSFFEKQNKKKIISNIPELNINIVIIIFLITFIGEIILSNLLLIQDGIYYGEIYKKLRSINYLFKVTFKISNYVNFFSTVFLIVYSIKNFSKSINQKKVYFIIILLLGSYTHKNFNLEVVNISKSDIIFFWYLTIISIFILKKFYIKKILLSGLLILFFFVTLSILRTHYTEGGSDIYFGLGEFISVNQNSLIILLNPKLMSQYEIFQSTLGFINLLPDFLLPYEKESIANHFMKNYFPSQYEMGFGRAFGLASQLVYESHLFLLIFKSFVLSAIFYYVSTLKNTNSNCLQLTFYIIFASSIYMIFRNHSFANIIYLLQSSIYFFVFYLPIMFLFKKSNIKI